MHINTQSYKKAIKSATDKKELQNLTSLNFKFLFQALPQSIKIVAINCVTIYYRNIYVLRIKQINSRPTQSQNRQPSGSNIKKNIKVLNLYFLVHKYKNLLLPL